MHSLCQILLEAQSAAQEHREKSFQALKSFYQSDPSSLYLQLSQILFDENLPKEARILSSLHIKNTIPEIWDSLNPNYCVQIKGNCLGSLASIDQDIVKSGAIAVSSIALIELAQNKWKDLLEVLITNAHNVHTTFKYASLLTLGYITERLSPDSLTENEKNKVLTALISNLAESDKKLQGAALEALKNSLRFYSHNFDNPSECSAILREVCKTFESLSETCLQLLCEITIFYPAAFVNDLEAIGNITYAAIRSNSEGVSILGMEVWTLIGNFEYSRIEDGLRTLGYIETAGESLVSLLLPKLFGKSDEDIWTESKASYTTLCGIVQVTGNKHTDKIFNFIQECLNVLKTEESIQAALFAVASYFESPEEIPQNVHSLVGKVIELMQSHSCDIKKNAIWCFGKISSAYCQLEKCQVSQATEYLLTTLQTHSKLKSQACNCLTLIFIKCFEYFDHHEYNRFFSSTFKVIKNMTLSNKSTEIINFLYTLAEKMPNQYISLFENYFEDIMQIYIRSLSEGDEIIFETITSITQIWCARLPAGKVTKKDSDILVTSIIGLFASHHKIFEESLQLIGALAMNLGLNFGQYLDKVLTYIFYSLEQLNSPGTLRSGIMAASDIARSLGVGLGNFNEKLIPPLIKVLESVDVCITTKVLCINCLGDLAGATQERFIEYLPMVLRYLDTAAGVSLQETQDIDVDFSLSELRECILQFYIGLVQGLASCKKQEVVKYKMAQLIKFISLVINEKYSPSQSMHMSALGLIGDIIETYKEPKMVFELIPYAKKFSHGNEDLHSISKWILGLTSEDYNRTLY